MDQGAAKSSDQQSFDKGNIAPDPGHQKSAQPDPKKQEHGDAEYWLMQPVYSKEYTENVEPRHIKPEKVSSAQNFRPQTCLMLLLGFCMRESNSLHKRNGTNLQSCLEDQMSCF